MTRQDLFEYVKTQYRTEPDYPWMDQNAVLRHKDNNKWYGIVMGIEKNKLGVQEEGSIDILNVKCDPVLIGTLRTQPGFYPAYHMNKDQWITICLDGSVMEEMIKNLLAVSFQLTKSRKK